MEFVKKLISDSILYIDLLIFPKVFRGLTDQFPEKLFFTKFAKTLPKTLFWVFMDVRIFEEFRSILKWTYILDFVQQLNLAGNVAPSGLMITN